MDAKDEYSVQRAEEEREAAQKASHPTARDVHLEMAKRYDALVSTLRCEPGRADPE